LAERVPVDCDPDRLFDPDQLPAAEQDVALEEFHFSVELVPLVMVLGVAKMLAVGGFAFTETVTD
jgi:hypothetical protein